MAKKNIDEDIRVFKSIEYDKFKFLNLNRKIDERHVMRLVDAIERKNLLSICPVIVSKNNEIIDGQHRIEAARKLETPFYYIVGDSLDHEDILSLNNTNKAWNYFDYINFFHIKKTPGFAELVSILGDYPSYSLSCILLVISEYGTAGLGSIKRGVVDISNIENAIDIFSQIEEYVNLLGSEKRSDKDLCKCIRKLYMGEYTGQHKIKYNHIAVIDWLKNQPNPYRKWLDIEKEFGFGEFAYHYVISKIQKECRSPKIV